MSERPRVLSNDNLSVAVVGASGGIGAALVARLLERQNVASLVAMSRRVVTHQDPRVAHVAIDLRDESSIASAAQQARSKAPFDVVIIASGWLHDGGAARPEKRLADLNGENFRTAFAVNAIGPALLARELLPSMNRSRPSVFASMSARVGSISDNRLGGWYAYRASKAAHNMIIKTLAIESARSNPQCVVAGLHPGTVDTPLSRPFQRNVPDGKLFSSSFAAERLLEVIDGLEPDDSGGCFDWAGKPIAP